MDNDKFFALNPDCILVKGVLRGALYDLKSGNVFSVDETSVKVLEKLSSGESLFQILRDNSISQEKLLAYLDSLMARGLGKWVSAHNKKEALIPPNPNMVLRYVLHLELTTGCNLRCLHCYNESEITKLSDSDVPSFDNWAHAIKEGYQIGCRRVQFIGGEPFLKRELLYNLILLACSTGYNSLEVSTNGTLITKKDLIFLKAHNASLAFSFYSYKDRVHDLITTKKGSWAKTLDSIRLALKMAIPLRVSVVKMNHNKEDVLETIKFLKSAGVKNAKINNVEPVGRGCSNELIASDILNQQIITKPFFPKINPDMFWRNRTGHNCFSEQICVGANGDIYPCLAERQISYGNIKLTPLVDILFSEKAMRFRGLSEKNIDVCQNCEYRYCCFDCRARAMDFLDNDFHPKPWWCSYNPYKGEWGDKEIYLKGGENYGKD